MAITIEQLMDAINSMGTGGSAAAPSTRESPDKIEVRLKLMEREEELLRRKASALIETDDALKNLIQKEKAELAVHQKMEEQAITELKLMKLKGEASQEELAAQQELIEKLEIEVDSREESIIAYTKEAAEIDKNTKARETQKKAIEGVSNSMMGMLDVYGKHSILNTGMIKGLYDTVKAVGPWNAIMGVGVGIMRSFIDQTIALTFGLDEARSSIMKTTGLSREFATGLTQDVQAMAFYGVTADDMAQTIGALVPVFTDFTRLNTAQASAVRETGDLLQKAGVDRTNYGKSLQVMTKSMGLGVEAAMAMTREFNSLAVNIGVTPQQMAEDFASVGGSLTKLGTEGPDAFKQLAMTAKATGLSIEKLLRITDKFDTFEGAATQAGLLNAALGGNFVNAMDLMMATNPAERFGMIQDAILNTGLSFDEMDYYQRKFYAEAAGLEDTNDLALLMSGSLDEMSDSAMKSSAEIHELQKRTEAMQSIQEKFKTLLMSMIPVLEPLIDNFHAFVMELRGSEEKMSELQGTFKSFGTAIMLIAENLEYLIYGFLIITGAKLLGGLALFVKQMGLFGTTAPVVGNGARMASGGILAFGAAILLVGGGIKLATEGIASMAAAFALLNPEQLTALNEAIDGLLTTFVIFAAVVMGVSFAASAAVGPMLAFGGAIALIGLGIAAPAAAIGYMAEGIASMIDAIDPVKLLALTGFVAKMALSPLAIAATVTGMRSIASAIAEIGEALNNLPFETMEMLNNLGATAIAIQQSVFEPAPAAAAPPGAIGGEGAALMDAINQVSAEKMAAAAVVVTVATTQAAAMNTSAQPLSRSKEASPVDVNVKVYVDGVVTKAVAAVDKKLKDLSLEQ